MCLFYFFQVPIKSISEFHKLYLSWCVSHKSVQKIVNELPRRSHKGLIVHVLSPSENGDTHLVGKMNFVDLAGFPNFQHLRWQYYLSYFLPLVNALLAFCQAMRMPEEIVLIALILLRVPNLISPSMPYIMSSIHWIWMKTMCLIGKANLLAC